MKRKRFIGLLSSLPILGIMNDLNALGKYVSKFPSTPQLPVLFIGHGSPMNAIEDNVFTRGMANVAKTLPVPNAILCISAHWYIKGTQVTAMEIPKTIHDFYGFPPELYEIQYPAKGNPDLANEVKNLSNNVPVILDNDWGLDHGTWSVLKHLYPEANIPVVQLSIDRNLTPEHHFNLAKQLQPLRGKGVLIIGSGNIVHNLGKIDWPNFQIDNHGYDWAIEAREWVNDKILKRQFSDLCNYLKQGNAMRMAVPTPDHFLPLLYALGFSTAKDEIEFFNDKLQAGSLSMTSVKIG